MLRIDFNLPNGLFYSEMFSIFVGLSHEPR